MVYINILNKEYSCWSICVCVCLLNQLSIVWTVSVAQSSTKAQLYLFVLIAGYQWHPFGSTPGNWPPVMAVSPVDFIRRHLIGFIFAISAVFQFAFAAVRVLGHSCPYLLEFAGLQDSVYWSHHSWRHSQAIFCANLTIFSCVYADDTVSPEFPDSFSPSPPITPYPHSPFSPFFLFLFLFHCQVFRGSVLLIASLILNVDFSTGPPHAVVLWTSSIFATLLPCSPCHHRASPSPFAARLSLSHALATIGVHFPLLPAPLFRKFSLTHTSFAVFNYVFFFFFCFHARLFAKNIFYLRLAIFLSTPYFSLSLLSPFVRCFLFLQWVLFDCGFLFFIFARFVSWIFSKLK